jgi:hypothetical protein
MNVGSEDHFGWLDGLIRALLVLNLLDAVFTLFWVHAGLAREANPLLRELVVHHPVAFVAAKLALVTLGSLLLWWRRHRPLAAIAVFVAFLAYYGLLLMHVGFLGKLLPALHASW